MAGVATSRIIAPSQAIPLFERAAVLAPVDPAVHRARAKARGWALLRGSSAAGDEQDIAQSVAR